MNAEPNETPTPAEGTKAAEKRAERLRKNGVTLPADGSKTRRVWEIADAISAEKQRPALRGEVMAAGKEEGLNDGTLATQYGKWCTFHKVDGAQRKEARAAEKAAAKAADEDEVAEAAE